MDSDKLIKLADYFNDCLLGRFPFSQNSYQMIIKVVCFSIVTSNLFAVAPSSPVCEIEVPERLTVSYEALKTRGVAQRCRQLPVRQATEQQILLAHRLVEFKPGHISIAVWWVWFVFTSVRSIWRPLNRLQTWAWKSWRLFRSSTATSISIR